MDIKAKVIEANKAYREGTPIISDAEFDSLLSTLETQMGFIAFEVFKQSLTEVNGDIKHDYVIGSLNKIRYNENDELATWLKKTPTNWLLVSEKLDGCSFVAKYRDGELVGCASRGDGYTGTNWFDKAKHILPTTISYKKDLDIRGEFCLTGDSHTVLGMKNRRNGVVGLMGKDEVIPVKLAHIKPFVYEILNSKSGLKDQLATLIELGFKVPFYTELYIRKDVEDELKRFYDRIKSNTDYDKDGLVISGLYHMNENEFYPKGKVAFKVNSEGVKCTVKGIEWNVSKLGALKPVVLIDPVEIDGATVSRVSGYNFKYILDNLIGVGTEIAVIRSGEVIPKIIKVIKNGYSPEFPAFCPCCNTRLIQKGVDTVCTNPRCSTKMALKVSGFLRSCGVENVTETSLENWGIDNFKKLSNFRADVKYRSQIALLEEMNNKVYNKTGLELFANLTFDGAATKTINKILTHFNINTFDELPTNVNGFRGMNLPDGIGETTINKIATDWEDNRKIVTHIMADSRYKGNTAPKATKIAGKLTGKTFCITGTLTKKRSFYEDLIKANGGEIASVSKTLNYLVVGTDAGSKLEKGKKLGITILDEKTFMDMI